MANFFRGMTQLTSTPFQQAIEKATDGNQPNEDWALIMKICDHVNIHEDGAKEAMKTIRKRLQMNTPVTGWRTVGLTLTLLEALTKNCGKIFHLQIAQKDFLKDFRGILAPKNNPPIAIQEKVLSMIQTWALAFRGDSDLINVEQLYQECKQQGLEFPPAEPESSIKAAVPATGTLERSTQYSRLASQSGSEAQSPQNRSNSDASALLPAGDNVVVRQMTPEQIAKLRSELDVVQTNVQVFGEMLVTLQPGEEHPQDLDLLLQLHKTCVQMQARIIDLLSQVAIDDITVDLLRHNDEFNNSLKTFENYMQERERRVGPSQMPILNHSTPSATAKEMSSRTRTADNEPALIKFDEELGKLPNNLQNMTMNQTSTDATNKTGTPPSTASVTTRPAASNQDSERDMKEVEQWLSLTSTGDVDNSSHTKPTVAPHAFDEYMNARAATIPENPISEQEIHIDLQQTSTANKPNA